MADINDVYAWMTTDGASINLAMTVSPFDPGNRAFGPTILYAFHLTSRTGFGMAGTESKIICKFADNTHGECWVVDPSGTTIDYVNGDLSGPVGRVSRSGKFRVFAGLRSDPFFFNFGGFIEAIKTAAPALPSLARDAAGCPQVDKATAGFLRNEIGSAPTMDEGPGGVCKMGELDCFAGANVMAIVVQIDKTELMNGTDKLLSVWGSTNMAQ